MIRLFQAIVKGSSKRRMLTVCLVFFLLASAVVKVMADSPPPPSQPGPIGNFTVTLVLGPLPSFFADKNSPVVWLQNIYAHLEWSPDSRAYGFDFNVTRWDGKSVEDDLLRMPSSNGAIRAMHSNIDLAFYSDEAGKTISFQVAPYYPWGGTFVQPWSNIVSVYVGNSTDTPKITQIKVTGDT